MHSSVPSKHSGQASTLSTHVNGRAPDPGISLQHVSDSSQVTWSGLAIVQVLEEAGPGWQR